MKIVERRIEGLAREVVPTSSTVQHPDSAPLSSRQVSAAGFPSHQGRQHSFDSPASVLMLWPAQEASAGPDADVSQQTRVGREP